MSENENQEIVSVLSLLGESLASLYKGFLDEFSEELKNLPLRVQVDKETVSLYNDDSEEFLRLGKMKMTGKGKKVGVRILRNSSNMRFLLTYGYQKARWNRLLKEFKPQPEIESGYVYFGG